MTDDNTTLEELTPISLAEDQEKEKTEPEKGTSADDPGGTLTAEENERFQQALAIAANVSRQITESVKRIWQPITDIVNQQRAIVEAARNPIIEAMQTIEKTSEPIVETIEAVKEAAIFTQQIMEQINRTAPTLKAMQNFYNSIDWQNIRQALIQSIETAAPLLEFAEEIVNTGLIPYLETELKKPEYEGKTIEELFDAVEIDETGKPSETSLFMQALTAARAVRDATEILPQLQSAGTSKYYTSPNTAIANVLSGNDGKGEPFTAGAFDLPVAHKGKKNETTIYTLATLENMEGVTISGKAWSEYDRAVHDAVVSIYEDRTKKGLPPVATADMVYRQMTGKTEGEFVSPQAKGAVTKSLEKQRSNTHIQADASAEMRQRKIEIDGKPLEKFKIDDFILASRKIEVQAGGKTVEAYLFNEPVLLTHARITGQITTVKTELLDIKKVDKKGKISTISISNSDYKIAARSYLLRRCKQAEYDFSEYRKKVATYKKKVQQGKAATKPKEPNSNIILYEAIFASIDVTNKNTKTNIKEYVLQVLQFWKAKGAIITDYRERKKGRGTDAVIIKI